MEQARALKALLAPLRVPLLINDRIDVALAVFADGAHVGEGDMPIALVRKLLEQAGAPKNLVLMPDASLKPAEIFFETSQGILDASVDTQLREIERGLIDKLER